MYFNVAVLPENRLMPQPVSLCEIFAPLYGDDNFAEGNGKNKGAASNIFETAPLSKQI
jgi:hypothetical protein